MKLCWLWTLALFFVTSGASATESRFTCPEVVSISAGRLAEDSIPNGYQGLISSAPIRLSGGNLFDGPPNQEAVLVPTFEHPAASKQLPFKDSATWMIEGGASQGLFISCDYGGGVARLFSKISGVVSSCVMKSERVKPHSTLNVEFVCK